MALTTDEALEALRFLSQLLQELGLPWVASQVEEKVAVGKLKTVKLRGRETVEPNEDSFFPLEGQRSRRVTKAAIFTVAEGYDPEEQLNILIDSIVIAVPQLATIATRAIDILGSFGIPEPLQFEPDSDLRESFSVAKVELESRSQASHTLQVLLEELRGGEPHASQAVPST